MVRSTQRTLILATAVLFCTAAAFASSGELMNFQGLGNGQPVGNFYNGGGLASTPNYGVTFSSNFFGLWSIAKGGAGNYAPTPLGTPAIFVDGTLGSPVTGIMNVAGGFSGGLNFFFTAGFTGGQTATVTLWSGANGTGTVLATLTLANNEGSCTSYCNWTSAGVTLPSGATAHSVTFSGPANEMGISDITLGSSTTAIPEPSSIYLLGTGIAGLSLRRIRRFLGV